MRLFLGWDVGAWHCGRYSPSQDALLITSLRDGEVVVAGKPWRGNLRSVLMAHSGHALAANMLAL